MYVYTDIYSYTYIYTCATCKCLIYIYIYMLPPLEILRLLDRTEVFGQTGGNKCLETLDTQLHANSKQAEVKLNVD